MIIDCLFLWKEVEMPLFICYLSIMASLGMVYDPYEIKPRKVRNSLGNSRNIVMLTWKPQLNLVPTRII